MKIRPSRRSSCDGVGRVLSGGLLSVAALACAMVGAWAEPTNGTIVAGGGVGASIGSVANGGGFNVTVQQNSAQMVVNWDDFNINANDAVNFVQPSSSAIAVNRVVGGAVTPTMIDGALSANGHVWILDPAGVAFGAGAVVDVGGLLATTSDIDTATFMATDPATGTFTFTQAGTGAVTNAANLEAQGLIALVAPMVTNSGSLTSDNGDVLLGGAKAFRLSFAEVDRTPAGGGAVYKELLVTDFIIDTGVDNAVAPAEAIPVTQTAAGSASGSNIIISAASVGGGAFLNIDGMVEATNVGTGSGSVMLLGGADLTGGVVAATGAETVRSTDLGVSATGALTVQAGAVSIAASAQDISVGSAAITAAVGDVSINDAVTATSGAIGITSTSGDVTLDAVTATTGAINITANTGDIDVGATTAGTTITLSAQDIDLAGKVDATTTAMLTATAGNVSSTGALEIEGSAVTVSGPILAGTDATVTATATDATLDAVTATTGAINITANTGGIDVGATTAGTTITLSAQDINLAGKVDATTTAMLTAMAGNVSSTGALEIEGSAVTVNGPILAGTDATVTATAADATLDAVTATAGAISINAATGNIDVGAATAGTSITLSAQDIDLAGKVDATTTAMLTATVGDVSSTGALEIEGSAVTVNGPTLGGVSATITATVADATLDAVTATTGAISITANTGDIDVGATTAGTTITMSAQDIDLAGKVDATTTAMLTATVGNVSSTGALEIEGSAVTVSGPVLAATGATITATSGNATLDAVTATTGAIAINAATGDIDVGATTAGTSISISGKDIDLAGRLTAGTSASLTATVGDVSSAGKVEIDAGSISLVGRLTAATDVFLTALTGGISSSGSISATLGDIIANAANGPISVNDLEATGDIRLVGTSVNVAGTATAHGSAFLQALTGNVSVGGSVTATGGALVLDASSGSALLNRIGALSDVTLTVADLDLSGSISAGDQFILETDRSGQTIVLGGDGTTGDVTLRRTAGLIIDESELTKISAGRFDIDGGANDVLLLDARLTTSSLDTMMIGTDQSSRIIAAGTVTGLTSLQLGYQTASVDRRPELILISGQLGLDTSTGRLGTVRLESADDIVIGTERFLEIFETESLTLLGLASLPLSVAGGVDDHVFVATEQLQILAPGSVVQQNTGRGVEGGGLVFNVPSKGDGVLFPSEDGPEEVLIFGEVIRPDGTRVSAFNASLEDNILFGGSSTLAEPALIQNGQYYMNFCLIGDPVSCSADSLREIERNNRFINGDPSGLGGVIPVVFETGENDERDEEEDLGGVAASGNEALWDAGSR